MTAHISIVESRVGDITVLRLSGRLELNEGDHHDHIVCLDCGRVEEFMDSGIEARQKEIAAKLGYQLVDHSMILYGRCKRPGCPSHDSGRNKS